MYISIYESTHQQRLQRVGPGLIDLLRPPGVHAHAEPVLHATAQHTAQPHTNTNKEGATSEINYYHNRKKRGL
eukprot:30626-Eustigmatos_ZCMA.PRE.1